MQTSFQSPLSKFESLGVFCQQWTPNLFFGGMLAPFLEIPVTVPCRKIRFSLDGYRPLHLPFVRILERESQIKTESISIQASSVYERGNNANVDAALAQQAYSMFGDILGEGVHTATDMNPWVEITLPRTMSNLRLRVGNRDDENAWRNWSLKVETTVDDVNWQVAYNHADLANSVKNLLSQGCSHSSYEDQALVESFIDALFSYIETGTIDRDKLVYKLDHVPNGISALTEVINKYVLSQFGHELNVHGVVRTFRFWSEAEKSNYLKDASKLIQSLNTLSPDVVIGYGSVLSYVRSGTFIDHDDDIDILIALDRQQYANIPDAVSVVENTLATLGWSVSGDFFAHRWVSLGHKNVDVFVGLREGDFVSFFPGPRCSLFHAEIFPAKPATLHGQEILIPNQPLSYLEKVYGPLWRTPDRNFSHTWDQSIFSDIDRIQLPAISYNDDTPREDRPNLTVLSNFATKAKMSETLPSDGSLDEVSTTSSNVASTQN